MKSLDDMRVDLGVRLTLAPRKWFRVLAGRSTAEVEQTRELLVEHLVAYWQGAELHMPAKPDAWERPPTFSKRRKD